MALESVLANNWSVLSALIDEALALPAAKRGAWLHALGVEHAAHLDTLRALLATQLEVETDDFLAELPTLPSAASAPAHAAPVAGSRVGAYRLIEPIGHGGMGSVWLAERADGIVKRRVALKLPHAVWGGAFTERLAREREILASLEHPHIARLYDAGVDAQGRPFLAMAYVAGKPIDVHCREHALSLRARVDLLLQVTAAVSHAHARLVVHRDLKPANIIVGDDGQAMLLDFGIAKLLDGERTDETALTALSGRALTLDYASPEQIRGEPLGTASDVYSLAVVAYEVLAGARPYRLKRATAAELEQAIADTRPPLASEAAAEPRLSSQLRGDLDAILNKALKKAPDERYPTMEAFAQDLRRFLAGDPVEAQPDRLAYRATKFVERYRLQVAAGALVAVALVAGTAVALWQAHEAQLSAAHARTEAQRAQTEAATSKAVQAFIESVFSATSGNQADPVAARATTARELLDRGADRIGKELAAEPEAQSRLYGLLGEMYSQMALFERSLELMQRNLQLATRLHGRDSEAALGTAVAIAQILDNLGRSDESLAMLLGADADADAAAGAGRAVGDATRMRIDTGLARLYFSRDLPKGLARARRAAVSARAQGPSLAGISALRVLGEIARRSGQLKEARQALTEAVAWIEQRPQGAAGELPELLGSLGGLQGQLGQPEQAAATFARAVELADRAGDQHSLHNIRVNAARYQYDNGLFREALATAAPDLAWARALGPRHGFGVLPALVVLHVGRMRVAWGDDARGLELIDEGRALLAPEAARRMAPFLAARADALVSLGRLAEAGAAVDQAMALLPGADAATAQAVYASRRRQWVASGKAEDALRDFAARPPPAGETATVYTALRRRAEEATLQFAAGQHSAARTTAATALADLQQLAERRFARDAEARATAVLGQALLRESRVAEALPALQQALVLHQALYDPAHSTATAQVRRALAEAQRSAVR